MNERGWDSGRDTQSHPAHAAATGWARRGQRANDVRVVQGIAPPDKSDQAMNSLPVISSRKKSPLVRATVRCASRQADEPGSLRTSLWSVDGADPKGRRHEPQKTPQTRAAVPVPGDARAAENASAVEHVRSQSRKRDDGDDDKWREQSAQAGLARDGPYFIYKREQPRSRIATRHQDDREQQHRHMAGGRVTDGWSSGELRLRITAGNAPVPANAMPDPVNSHRRTLPSPVERGSDGTATRRQQQTRHDEAENIPGERVRCTDFTRFR